eukprot:6172397-Pleurochrysis_carterae.AAC.3
MIESAPRRAVPCVGHTALPARSPPHFSISTYVCESVCHPPNETDTLRAVLRDVAIDLSHYDAVVRSPSVEMRLPSVIVSAPARAVAAPDTERNLRSSRATSFQIVRLRSCGRHDRDRFHAFLNPPPAPPPPPPFIILCCPVVAALDGERNLQSSSAWSFQRVGSAPLQ